MAYVYLCPKRFDDLNADGSIDHAVIIDYLQEARIEFLLSAPEPMSAMLDTGVLVAAHRIEYLAPIGSSEPVVRVQVWIDRVGGAQFSLSYSLTDGDLEVARARTTAVAYDLGSSALRRLTAAERDQLSAARAAGVELTGFETAFPRLDDAHHSRCRVRWADLDSYGHVNNVRFFDYFSQARLELLTGSGSPDGAESWRVTRQDVTYKLPLDFRREPYLIRTAATDIGGSHVEFAADIVADPDQPKSLATSRAVVVHTRADGRPASIGDQLRDRLTGPA